MHPLPLLLFANRSLSSSIACSFGVALYQRTKVRRQPAPLFANRRESR